MANTAVILSCRAGAGGQSGRSLGRFSSSVVGTAIHGLGAGGKLMAADTIKALGAE